MNLHAYNLCSRIWYYGHQVACDARAKCQYLDSDTHQRTMLTRDCTCTVLSL